MGMLGIRMTIDTGPGLTKQSFADEVDINKIIARFDKTGMISHLNDREPFYGDVSEFRDYQDSLNMVMRADELFMGMSADVRSRFSNDPVQMISFLDDPKNYDEAVKLGMITPRVEPEPQKVEVVNMASKEPIEPVVEVKSRKANKSPYVGD